MRPSLEIAPHSTDYPDHETNYEEIPSTSRLNIMNPNPWEVLPSNYTSEQSSISTREPRQEQNFPVGMFIQQIGPITRPIDNQRSERALSYPPSFSGRASTIYINPSILLSHQRANYQGPGTPMPLLPTAGYPYSCWSQPASDELKSRESERKRGSRSKKKLKIKIRVDNNSKSTRLADEHCRSRRNVIEQNHRCEDARDWLNERAAREKLRKKSRRSRNQKNSKNSKKSSRKSKNSKAVKSLEKTIAPEELKKSENSEESKDPEDSKILNNSKHTKPLDNANNEISKGPSNTVDRATSPINFDKLPLGEIQREKRDIALSPIRCIEPLNRG